MSRGHNEDLALPRHRQITSLVTPGDVIRIPTESHTHYGIYAGYDFIVHLAGIKGCTAGFFHIEVQELPLMLVAKGNIAYVEKNEDCYQCPTKLPSEVVLKRAQKQRGSQPYDSKFQSCKHFVDWCRFEEQEDKEFMTGPDDFEKVIQCHNFNVLRLLQPGNIVEIQRELYLDRCIYVGNNNVVHVSCNDTGRFALSWMPLLNALRTADVKEENFFKTASGCVTRMVYIDDDDKRPLPKEEIVRRARSKIGKIPYQVLHKNCEHFVYYCRYGLEKNSVPPTLFGALVLGSSVGGFLIGGPVGAVAVASFFVYKLLRYANEYTLDQNKN